MGVALVAATTKLANCSTANININIKQFNKIILICLNVHFHKKVRLWPIDDMILYLFIYTNNIHSANPRLYFNEEILLQSPESIPSNSTPYWD